MDINSEGPEEATDYEIGVAIRMLSSRGTAPTRATPFSAGFDLYSAENMTLVKGESGMVWTHIALAIPCGLCALILPRSGLSRNFPNYIRNAPGLVDSDYRGEIGISVINNSNDDWRISQGDRIAQMLFVAHAANFIKFIEVNELPGSLRGAGGFGSTGL